MRLRYGKPALFLRRVGVVPAARDVAVATHHSWLRDDDK
jgi:hypothetical protein